MNIKTIVRKKTACYRKLKTKRRLIATIEGIVEGTATETGELHVNSYSSWSDARERVKFKLTFPSFGTSTQSWQTEEIPISRHCD